MVELELFPTNYQLIRLTLISLDIRPKSLLKEAASIILYQKKMGLVLYTATTTRPDITFIVSRLARFN